MTDLIAIASRSGSPKSAVAEMRTEHFAAHQPIDFPESSRLDITHIPTGFSVARSVTRRQAKCIMQELEELPISWDSTDRAGFQQYSDAVKAVIFEITGGLMP